jgi:hypothetical protein
MRERENPKMTMGFDPQASAYVLKPGSATVRGTVSATTRQGKPFVGRHARLSLVPATAYSDQYFKQLFGGKRVLRWPARVANVDGRFDSHMRLGSADGQGRFTIYGVPAGRYYLYAKGLNDGSFFGVVKLVAVARGQTVDVVIDGN